MREKVIRFQENTSSLLLILMSLFVFLQVVSRFAIKVPVGWTEELSKIFLIWLTYVALAPTFARNVHVRIDLIDQYLSKKAEVILRWINHFIGLVFGVTSLLFIYYFLQSQLQFGQSTPVLNLPMTIILIPLLAGVALTLIYFLIEIIHISKEVMKTWKGGDEKI